jgi:hypothetical protein
MRFRDARINLINGIVMLSVAKHLWSISFGRSKTDPEILRSAQNDIMTWVMVDSELKFQS